MHTGLRVDSRETRNAINDGSSRQSHLLRHLRLDSTGKQPKESSYPTRSYLLIFPMVQIHLLTYGSWAWDGWSIRCCTRSVNSSIYSTGFLGSGGWLAGCLATRGCLGSYRTGGGQLLVSQLANRSQSSSSVYPDSDTRLLVCHYSTH